MSCSCGCSSMTIINSAEGESPACECSCTCCAEEPKSTKEKVDELKSLRESIDRALAGLQTHAG